jgi:hypothetical protein
MRKLIGLVVAVCLCVPGFSQQVVGQYTSLDSYPYINLSDADKAHAAAATPPEEAERAQRLDKRHMPPLFNDQDPSKSGTTHFLIHYDYNSDFDYLHIKDSDVIAVGTVTKAVPHLGVSKGYVYSTFQFTPASVLMGSLDDPSNKPILLEREGGVVLLPDGKKHFIGVSDWGLPVPGNRYVLFLKAAPKHDAFTIVGGYALDGNHVTSLDMQGTRLNNLAGNALVSQIETDIAATR